MVAFEPLCGLVSELPAEHRVTPIDVHFRQSSTSGPMARYRPSGGYPST
jgi:hypothetical protein